MSATCYCDYDQPTWYRSKTVTARKVHRCIECSHKIQPGERYDSAVGMWEGRIKTWPTCDRCVDLREFVRAHVPCFCWAHGNLHDDAIAEAECYAHDAPGLLFGAYRRMKLTESRWRNHAKRAA